MLPRKTYKSCAKYVSSRMQCLSDHLVGSFGTPGWIGFPRQLSRFAAPDSQTNRAVGTLYFVTLFIVVI